MRSAHQVARRRRQKAVLDRFFSSARLRVRAPRRFRARRPRHALPGEEERKTTVTLNIKSKEADRLARELAAATGESITAAVTAALAERLARVRRGPVGARDAELKAIWERASKVPAIDLRSDDEILGYNDTGAFD